MIRSSRNRANAKQGAEASALATRSFGAGGLRRAAKVLPEHARAHNRSLVLQTLFHEGAMSRADLARETGLTRVTISDLVAELIGDALVAEHGPREAAGPGQPAILVDLARDGHCIVGLDLSRFDHLVGAVMSLDGEILLRREVRVPADPDAAIEAITSLARDLVLEARSPVLGVGIGTPGIVDDEGVVLVAPNFRWTDVDLQGILSLRLRLPVVVANDANAAVLAEYTFGGAGEDVLLVRVGRGVGSGLLAGGQPLGGSHFAAGEIGHVTVGTDGGPPCVCGKVGCLEAWLSGPALQARLSAAPDAREAILRDAGERLGIALAPVVGVLDLSEIVLSGPAELIEGPLADATLQTLRSRTLAPFHGGVEVRMTAFGEDVVLMGAAVMVLSACLGVS